MTIQGSVESLLHELDLGDRARLVRLHATTAEPDAIDPADRQALDKLSRRLSR